MDEPSEYVDFMVKYKDWISIKRLGIRPDTKPQEIAFALAGIRATADTRSYSILGINTATLDACADSITKGQKKSFDSLAAALSKAGSAEAKRAVDESCQNKELTGFASAYLMSKIISNVGYETSISQTAMSKIWKELKPPKPRGRAPKA
ncbi:MAG: DUF2666 family protein [Candidatus Micrarchaeota archaeon]|nr:DUF2666 family protein [Candidatus Micrarchaeota archaeon]